MSKNKTRDINVETFAFGNTKSIKALTPNGPGEEISPRSYLRFIQLYVRKKGGVVDQADLEIEIERHFGGIWGPDDLRPIRSVGGHTRPKWKNSLDWAKVMARHEDPPILARTQWLKTGKFTALVLIDKTTDPEWLEWVQNGASEISPKNAKAASAVFLCRQKRVLFVARRFRLLPQGNISCSVTKCKWVRIMHAIREESDVNADNRIVRIIHGANDGYFDLAGTTVGNVPGRLSVAFNIPEDSIAFVNGQIVPNGYRLRVDDVLEFVTKVRRKTADRKT